MIYLNNAATSWPKAPGVAEAVAGALKNVPDDEGRATAWSRGRGINSRALLAQLLGIEDQRRVILTPNATTALNIALLGFPWNCGDIVLTTQAEHNSVLRPLYALKKQGIINYVVMPVGRDGRISLADWSDAIARYRPRMVVFSHASNVSGAVNDVSTLCAKAKQMGCAVLLDCAQSIGLFPITPMDWGVDLLAFTGHKYLLAPQGTGGLYVAEGMELKPVYTGGTGVRSDEDEMPQLMPLHLEAGTGNAPGFAGLAAAIEYAHQNPIDLMHISQKAAALEEGIKRLGMQVIEVSGVRTPVLACTSLRYDSGVLGEILAGSYDIISRTGLHCTPLYPNLPGGTLRLSLSRFTTDEQLDQTLDALKEIHSA